MIDQARYNALYDRFQKQVSIKDCPDKLSDKELEELILAMREDAATSGQRAARKSSTGAKTKTSTPPPSANALAFLLEKAQELKKG